MGNAAAKQLEETALAVGAVKPDDKKAIAKTMVSDDTMKIKSKGKTWVSYGDGADDKRVIWTYKHVGTFKKHTLVEDAQGVHVATILTAKKGMASCSNVLCKDTPSYEGQTPLTEEELKAAGVKEHATALYPFAKYDTKRTMTTAKCTYGLVTGQDAVTALYEGEKLSSMGFKAIFREAAGGTAVAKAHMPGMTMTPHLEAAGGVDLLAVVSMGYALAGDESSAGALAGAGVV